MTGERRPPIDEFDDYLTEVERDPKRRARQDRIDRLRARRPLHPYYSSPALGLAIVAVLLVLIAVARLLS